MISEVVGEFCSQYGLANVSMEEGGSLRFSIDSIGELQFVNKNSKLLMGLSRKIENPYLLNGRKILGHCHFKESNLKPLHAQLKDEMLVLFYAFEENEVISALLSQALDSLTDTMDKIL